MSESLDKYRSYLSEEELKTTQWINGPPNYDDVNKLFEEGRTNIWPVGSLEEQVQRLVKTWEMEIVHKANPDDYKTLDAEKFTLGTNGKNFLTLQEIGVVGGSYNVFLHTSLPPSLRFFDPEKESTTSSQAAFKNTFARGFAFEIIEVFSGPPKIAYRFRHWGYFEKPFQGHAPTGELIEFFGMAAFELDGDSFTSKVVKVDIYSERGELLSGLIKGKTSDDESTPSSGCPFMA